MDISPLPEELRRLRKRKGFTVYDVAERIGMSPPMISVYETRRGVNVPEENLRKLATLYGVEYEYLHFLSLPIPTEYKRIIAEDPRAPRAIHRHLHIRPASSDVTILQKLYEFVAPGDRSRVESYREALAQIQMAGLAYPLSLWVQYYHALLGLSCGNWSASMAQFETVYVESGPPESPRVPDLWCRTAQGLGHQYAEHGYYSRAIPYRHRCREFFSQEDDFAGLGLTLMSLAEICEATGDEPSMREYCKHGLGAVGDHVSDVCAAIRQTYGDICARRSEWDSAELSLLRAGDVWDQLGNRERSVESRLLLADVYRQQKRWAKARRQLDSAQETFQPMAEPTRLRFSGHVDHTEAQLLWYRGERGSAIRTWQRLETIYARLAPLQRDLFDIASRASGSLVMAFASEEQFESAFKQARSTLAELPLDCPRDAEIQAQVLRHLSPALGMPDHAVAIRDLLDTVTSRLSDDTGFAPLWATISSMKAQLAANRGAWEDVASAVYDAIRWTFDAELVAARRSALDALTEPTHQMLQYAPDIADALRRELGDLIADHAPPSYGHLWEPVPDWLRFTLGVRVES